MADEYTVTNQNSGGFEPTPEGLQQVVCVDGIFLGHTVDQFQNNAPKLVEKYALVFQTDERVPATGKRYEIHREFTISFGPKANLRKFLAAWRGRAYTDEEAKHVPLHKVIGHNGLATVEHRVSQAGRTYAVLSNISPLMRGAPTIAADGYERAPFWEERKAEYKAKADAFIAAQQKVAAGDEHAGVGADDDADDSLPF